LQLSFESHLVVYSIPAEENARNRMLSVNMFRIARMYGIFFNLVEENQTDRLPMKYRILVVVAYVCGLVPMLGGIGIFGKWWWARFQYADNLEQLKATGMHWFVGSTIAAVLGLMLSATYIYLNRKLTPKPGYSSIYFILLNIPILLVVLYLQNGISKKAYVRFENKCNQKGISILILNANTKEKEGDILDGQFVVVSCDPPDVVSRNQYYMPTNKVVYVVRDSKVLGTFAFKQVMTGGVCETITLDSDLKFREEFNKYSMLEKEKLIFDSDSLKE
jgi:hypothetical protein